MNTDNRIYYICKEPSTYNNKYECRPIGDNSNLRFFKEDANIKYICKHIPAELRKTVFETKYPDSSIISLLGK